VKILVNVDIKRILTISEVDGIFETQQEIGLEWRDPRMKLHNLRPFSHENTLREAEKNNIWIPSITFANTATMERSLRDNASLVTLARKGGMVRSKMTEVLNIYIYEGSENSFLITRVYSTKWLCSYDMLFYPFDTQSCSMLLTPSGNSAWQLELIPNNQTYSGDKELTQYFIRKSSMQLSEDNSTISVKVVLGRRLLGVFMTIYMPTILMNVVGHCTMYFKPFFFEAQVSVNLTVMLVLTTMFVSVSNDLPRTSYLKMVDIWLIFNLFIPFLEVLLHTYKDNLQVEEDREVNHHGKTIKVEDFEKKEKDSAKPVDMEIDDFVKSNPRLFDKAFVSTNEEVQHKALKIFYETTAISQEKKLEILEFIAKVVNPLVIATFVVVYWVVGLIQYRYPNF